jgi:hypothetical protein
MRLLAAVLDSKIKRKWRKEAIKYGTKVKLTQLCEVYCLRRCEIWLLAAEKILEKYEWKNAQSIT